VEQLQEVLARGGEVDDAEAGDERDDQRLVPAAAEGGRLPVLGLAGSG